MFFFSRKKRPAVTFFFSPVLGFSFAGFFFKSITKQIKFFFKTFKKEILAYHLKGQWFWGNKILICFSMGPWGIF